MTILMRSDVKEAGDNLGWHLTVKRPQPFGDLQQLFDRGIGELVSEWVHRVVRDSPILDAEYPSGHVTPTLLARNPKRIPDQSRCIRNLNQRASLLVHLFL